jgi:hypothetical protein
LFLLLLLQRRAASTLQASRFLLQASPCLLILTHTATALALRFRRPRRNVDVTVARQLLHAAI